MLCIPYTACLQNLPVVCVPGAEHIHWVGNGHVWDHHGFAPCQPGGLCFSNTGAAQLVVQGEAALQAGGGSLVRPSSLSFKGLGFRVTLNPKP